jgi:hypothetical protein
VERSGEQYTPAHRLIGAEVKQIKSSVERLKTSYEKSQDQRAKRNGYQSRKIGNDR